MSDKITWKDNSSYSRNDKQRTPTVLQADLGEVHLIVHRHIYHDGWVMSSKTLGLERETLKENELVQAKIESLAIMKSLIDKKIAELYHANLIIMKSF